MGRTLRTCEKGHRYYKSSNCPVCPMCWAHYYRKEAPGDLPEKLPAPAFRALLHAGITQVAQLAAYTETDLLKLHGMGKASLPVLREALARQGVSFKT